MTLPDFTLKSLDNDTTTTISQLKGEKPMVLIFWQGNCKYCPPALDKLTQSAASNNGAVEFIPCALEKGEGSEEVCLQKMKNWPTLSHFFVTESVKEELKAALDFKTVPHALFVDKDGNILKSDDPKILDFPSLIQQIHTTENTKSDDINLNTVDVNTFTLDEDF